jgi:hypothetical protein
MAQRKEEGVSEGVGGAQQSEGWAVSLARLARRKSIPLQEFHQAGRCMAAGLSTGRVGKENVFN